MPRPTEKQPLLADGATVLKEFTMKNEMKISHWKEGIFFYFDICTIVALIKIHAKNHGVKRSKNPHERVWFLEQVEMVLIPDVSYKKQPTFIQHSSEMIRLGSVCHLKVPGESKKVYAFGEVWNKKYVTDVQN